MDGEARDVETAESGVGEQRPAPAAAGSDSDPIVEPDEVTGIQDEYSAADEADAPGGTDEVMPLDDIISDEIRQLAAERDQFKDIAQRLQADFENYRKRVAAQQSAEIDRATGALAEALLPVLDAAEAAYVRHPDEVGPLLNLLLAELRKQGLESVDLLGKAFDPNLADAVAHESGDGGEVVVAEVLRSGYTWNGRTLRPAMVRTRD